ncbi:hypothetical protein [Parasitella parasitica]|uniref:Uncharacterized protein n=1 Tax=Parasitella parasitica TaxID=35722 RepID=A0A0B7NCN2_9FUNG|nr:hypothetical protein [Parasitella parasitica]
MSTLNSSNMAKCDPGVVSVQEGSVFKSIFQDTLIIVGATLQYPIKLYHSGESNYQCTMTLKKNNQVYSCYIFDWDVLVSAIQLQVGDYVLCAGVASIGVKQNANGYMKVTMKIQASEFLFAGKHFIVSSEKNDATRDFLLLKYLYVNFDSKDKVECAYHDLTKLKNKMNEIVTEGLDNLQTVNNYVSIDREKRLVDDKVNKTITKKKKVDKNYQGILACLNLFDDMETDEMAVWNSIL